MGPSSRNLFATTSSFAGTPGLPHDDRQALLAGATIDTSRHLVTEFARDVWIFSVTDGVVPGLSA
jgi:hypothetical protein